MTGNQLISGNVILQSANPDWHLVGTPDLNGDGNPDLVWQHGPTGAVNYWIMSREVYTGGNGVITSNPGSPSWMVVGTPDLTNDGQPDLLWWNSSSGQVNYWEMNGATATGAWGIITQSPDLNWRIVGIH